MNASHACPNCGTPIASHMPAGLCPKCLLQAGLESQRVTAPSPRTAYTGFTAPELSDLAARFPQFEFLALLGKGGMGAVYKARQRGLDRVVAIKILPPEVGADPAFAERFTREARALARLNHPHIVAVFDIGHVDNLYFFVMEYVEGVNLRQAIAAERLPPAQALAIISQVCDALQFAHDEGIVHRDIKPENILLDARGRVKIADFGLAKLIDPDETHSNLTGTHQVMGTLRYMAPEQMEGSKLVDHRADIYSLGVVFYELLTGELPIGRFAPPSRKVQVDVRLDEIVLRTLEKEPELRYQHASDVRSEVQDLDHRPRKSFFREPSSSWTWMVGVLTLCIMVAGLLTAFRPPRESDLEVVENALYGWSDWLPMLGLVLLLTCCALGGLIWTMFRRDAAQSPRLVPVLAVFNLLIAPVLMLAGASEVEPLPATVAPHWHAWQQIDAVLGFIMAAGLFIGSIGLLLWQAWARKLLVGMCIFGLAAMVVSMPFLARVVIPQFFAEVGADYLAMPGTHPDMRDFVAYSVTALLVGGGGLVGLVWLIGQLMFLTRPSVIAAFPIAVSNTSRPKLKAPPPAYTRDDSPFYQLGSLLGLLKRQKWFTTALQIIFSLVYTICLIMFFSFSSTRTMESSSFHVGQPAPWLVMEATPTGFSHGIYLLVSSIPVALVGLVALVICRWAESCEKPRVHSMWWHYSIWLIMTLAVIMLGFTFNKPAPSIQSPPQAEQAPVAEAPKP